MSARDNSGRGRLTTSKMVEFVGIGKGPWPDGPSVEVIDGDVAASRVIIPNRLEWFENRVIHPSQRAAGSAGRLGSEAGAGIASEVTVVALGAFGR